MIEVYYPPDSPVAQEVHRLMTKRTVCDCLTHRDLLLVGIDGYEHDGGWDVAETPGNPAGRYWLYITCPSCRYQWAIWKLGVDRQHTFGGKK